MCLSEVQIHYLWANDSDYRNSQGWQPMVEGDNQMCKEKVEDVNVGRVELVGKVEVAAVVEVAVAVAVVLVVVVVVVVAIAKGLQVALVGEVVPMVQRSYCMVPDPGFRNKSGKHGDKLVCR